MITMRDYIKSFELITQTQNTIAYMIDHHSTIVAVSSNFRKEFGLTRRDKIIGLTYVSLTHPQLSFFSINHEQLTNDDKLIYSDKSHHVYLYIMNKPDTSQLFTVHKYPLIINNKVKGIYVYMQPYCFPRIPDITFLTFGLDALYSRSLSNNYTFTHKQAIVLYFLIRNYSYTHIATWLSAYDHPMSVARVNEHINNLKNIFQVTSREELITKALYSGCYSNMPLGLLPTGSYLIDEYIFKLKINDKLSITINQAEFVQPVTVEDNILIYMNKPSANPELLAYIDQVSILYQVTDRAVYFLDLTHQIVAVSQEFQNLDITDHTAFINHNVTILKLLHITPKNDIYVITNSPIHNTYGVIIGYHIEVSPYYMPSVPKITQQIFKKVRLPESNKAISLTKTESAILYFYMRNFWSEAISDILNQVGFKIGHTTVNKHLNNIKQKLGLTDKNQLIDHAIIYCYHYIPHDLVRTGTYNLDNTIIDQWYC